MKKLLAALFLIILPCLVFCQQQNYWQQKVDNDIQVTLNDQDHSIDGMIKMNYYNNSPDTLHFIWIHLWPNAYKNDRTAFSDQLLENGNTDFYFSKEGDKGYINRLNFTTDGILAKMEDHPQHQDIVKLILPNPLPPEQQVMLITPFHVKLPKNFSRGGHIDQSYQLTQWYPKPAVYDKKGWHPIPYLDQGEFYSEFGTFDVKITLPLKYKVAATGLLKDSSVQGTQKTLQYQQENIHDFAWFADEAFEVKHDTLQLAQKTVDVYVYYKKENAAYWTNAVNYTKAAIRSKSELVGGYPYPVVSVVERAGDETGGGMEYPTITLVSKTNNEKLLEYLIYHEVGHNWFYGILASNERLHPWMDEGMNSYYDQRYFTKKYGAGGVDFVNSNQPFVKKRQPDDFQSVLLQTIIGLQKDQPIATSSAAFSQLNYNLVAYTKTAQWMQLLEQKLGRQRFDDMMHAYYDQYEFKHPGPEDFKELASAYTDENLDSLFGLLYKKGNIEPVQKKTMKLQSFFSFKDTDKYNYLFVAPALGYNYYDKLMLGAVVHNYTLPLPKLQFLAAPLYATGSKQLNGLGLVSYNFFPGNNGQKITFTLAGARFTGDSFTDSTGTKNFQPFSKLVPAVKFTFAEKNPRSTITRYLQFKTFLINETGLLFTRDNNTNEEIITYPKQQRYVNQLRFVVKNARALYPYNATLQVDQGKAFVRSGFTGNYFFNYASGGGMNVRLFAGKFFYTGDKTFLTQYETDRYHLNMTGPKGYEDYTYSNYFIGRNEFEGFSNQQIMIRDGAFKVRTDLLSSKIGKTDNWLTALNFTTTVPKNINPLSLTPLKIPLKVFADIGTYAEAWEKDAGTSRFLFDAGLQVSLFSNTLNIYLPIIYSKVYSNYFKSTITEKRFLKTISFSIDIQNLTTQKLFPQIPF